MSSGWDEPPDRPDGESEAEGAQPAEAEYGWPEAYRWPETAPEPPGEPPEPPPHHPTRDPLARVFPGLPHGVRVTLDWVLTIAGAVLIVLALKAWVVNPYRIPSSSMEPALHCARNSGSPGCLGSASDRVLACRVCLDFGGPSRGDIVVFNTPSEAALKCGEGGTFVKRVIGLPGETVREDDSGNIWIRGPTAKKFVELKESYVSKKARLADSVHFGQMWHVPKGEYFMMGDNRGESCDSRSWGSVPRSKLIGTVFFIYWPLNRIGFK